MIFFNLLWYILRCRMWSILGDVPCKLYENVYPKDVQESILLMSVRSNCLLQLFKSPISYWSPISLTYQVVTEVLKFPTIKLDLSISPVTLISFGLLHFGALLLCSYIFKIVMSFGELTPLLLCLLFMLDRFPCSEVYLV